MTEVTVNQLPFDETLSTVFTDLGLVVAEAMVTLQQVLPATSRGHCRLTFFISLWDQHVRQ